MTLGFGEPGVDIWLLVAVSEGRWDLQRIHSISTRSGAAGSDTGRRPPEAPDSGDRSTEAVSQAPCQLAMPNPPACLHPSRVLLQLGLGPRPLSPRLSLRLPGTPQPSSHLASDPKQPGCRSCPRAAFAAVPPLTRVLMQAALCFMPWCKGRQT